MVMLQDENMHDRVFLSFLWGVTGLSYISALLDTITSLKTIDVLQTIEEKAKQVEILVYIQSTEMKYMMMMMMTRVRIKTML